VYRLSVESYDATALEKEILRRIEAHSGRRKSGTCKASFTQFAFGTTVATQSQLPPSTDNTPISSTLKTGILQGLYELTLSEAPRQIFLFALHPTARAVQLLHASSEMHALLPRISNVSEKHKKSTFGMLYDLADFTLRVCLLMDKSKAMGVVLDVEYGACDSLAECFELLDELVSRLCAPLVAAPPLNNGTEPIGSAISNLELNYERIVLTEDEVKGMDVSYRQSRSQQQRTLDIQDGDELPPGSCEIFSLAHLAALYYKVFTT